MEEIFDFLHDTVPPIVWVYIAVNVALGIFNLIMFTDDKFNSMGGGETMGRTTVYTLLCLPAIGGVWGPLIAMKKWTHKTKKKYFAFVYIMALLVHIGVLVLLFVEGV